MARFRHSALFLVGACVWGAGAAGQAAAQAAGPATGRLRGAVVDAVTYEPVESASVSLVGSDAEIPLQPGGGFELDAPVGPVVLHVTAPGHATVVVDTEARAEQTVVVIVELPSIAVTLNELLVQANGDGNRSVAQTAADLIAQEIPRMQVGVGQVGRSDLALNLRLAATFGGQQAPAIVVDGVVLSRGPEAFERLDRIPAADVAEVQVLRGPSAAFLYPFGANGVILVTTKRGQQR